VARSPRPADPAADEAAFRAYLGAAARRVDEALGHLLPPARTRPRVLHDAMRYTALSPGKRLRPALVLLAHETAGGRPAAAAPIAAALEMVHAFTLIHDDLPSMDDDDMRRGRPANHVVFGEGTAILAGDALLTEAFAVLARVRRRGRPETAAKLVAELAEASGSGGVVGGQVLDLRSEGTHPGRGVVDFIHRRKTARLFMAALRLGGISGGASPALLRTLTAVGETSGLAFQIVDDILSEAGTRRELGRDPGRDRERGKVTYPSVRGLTASHRRVDRLLAEAGRAVERLPARREVYRGYLRTLDRRRRDAEGGLLGSDR
jgi:geranylgeranyl diphosphate synthase type II